VFTDSLGRLLVVEIKKGILSRDAIAQILDHFGSMKFQHADKVVEMMVIANQIPPERKATLANYNIEWREITEQRIREVAAEKGYNFQSEQAKPAFDTPPLKPTPSRVGNGPPELTDGWIKVVWKDDCADALRKEARARKVYGDSWDSTEIHGMILTRLRDQQTHLVDDLYAAVGGSAGDIKEKIKHVAHRGNCTSQWSIYRTPDWKRVRMRSSTTA
jgi:hypothetical protein